MEIIFSGDCILDPGVGVCKKQMDYGVFVCASVAPIKVIRFWKKLLVAERKGERFAYATPNDTKQFIVIGLSISVLSTSCSFAVEPFTF